MKTLIFLLIALIAPYSFSQTKILTTGEGHIYSSFGGNVEHPTVINMVKGGLVIPLWNELDKDNYAIAVVGNGFSITPDIFFKVYDFAPTEKYQVLAKLYCMDTIIATGKNSSIRSIQDIKKLESQGKFVNIAIIAGSGPSIAIVKVINEHYKINLNIVPYSTYPQYKTDLMAGHIDLGITESSLFGAEFMTGDLVPVLNVGANDYKNVERMKNKYELPFQFCYYALANKNADKEKLMLVLKEAKTKILGQTDGLSAHLIKYFVFDEKKLSQDVLKTRQNYQKIKENMGIEKQ